MMLELRLMMMQGQLSTFKLGSMSCHPMKTQKMFPWRLSFLNKQVGCWNNKTNFWHLLWSLDVNFFLVINKFNMQMGNVTFPAEITDCDNCEQNFLNSTRMGRWTTKLWRSKAITGTNFRVLTVSFDLVSSTSWPKSVFQISTSICGHHETGFNLVYRYNLESNKKKSIFYFDFKLAPGTIVGHINLNLSVDPLFKTRSNLAQALEPTCTVANQTPLAQRNRKKSIERNVCSGSDSSGLRSPSRRFKRRNHRDKRSNNIEIGASDQRKFGEHHGLKRWIHLYLKPKSFPIIRQKVEMADSDLNFPVSPEEHETCQALLIVSKMKWIHPSIIICLYKIHLPHSNSSNIINSQFKSHPIDYNSSKSIFKPWCSLF